MTRRFVAAMAVALAYSACESRGEHRPGEGDGRIFLCAAALRQPDYPEFRRAMSRAREVEHQAVDERYFYLLDARCDGVPLVEVLIDHDAEFALAVLCRGLGRRDLSLAAAPMVATWRAALAPRASDPPARARLRACIKWRFDLALDHHKPDPKALGDCGIHGSDPVFDEEWL